VKVEMTKNGSGGSGGSPPLPSPTAAAAAAGAARNGSSASREQQQQQQQQLNGRLGSGQLTQLPAGQGDEAAARRAAVAAALRDATSMLTAVLGAADLSEARQVVAAGGSALLAALSKLL
jgi:hypothetical protein